MSNQQDKSCYVGNYHQIEREAIRETVCRDLSVENDGYCLLHSPRLDKDQQEFERFFGERISQNRSHFEAVVFPIPIDLNHCAFSLPLNFMRATFLSSVTFYKMRIKYVSFDYARFQGLAQFHRSSFDEVATFTGATFCREARFTGSYFKASKFDHVTFSGPTQFNSGAKFFEAADFSSTKFVGKTDFDTATFESSVSFDEAEFDTGSQVSFFMSSFRNEASFKKAIFRGYISFDGVNSHEVFGNGSTLSLRKARLEASEEVAFHSVRLRPHWFVDTDSRRFVFTNIKWEGENGRAIRVKNEIASLENRNTPAYRETFATHRLLSIACRQLADNAETNDRFEEASMFRRMAMETEWLEKKGWLAKWIRKVKNRFSPFVSSKTVNEVGPDLPTSIFSAFRRSGDCFIHGLYRWTSYYGESWAWALIVFLLVVLVVFPTIYMFPRFQLCPKERPLAMSLAVCESKDELVKKSCECRQGCLGFGEAVVHSLTTATLQSVDYRKPTTKPGEIVGILEKIAAPLQAALLALALRRKFMR